MTLRVCLGLGWSPSLTSSGSGALSSASMSAPESSSSAESSPIFACILDLPLEPLSLPGLGAFSADGASPSTSMGSSGDAGASAVGLDTTASASGARVPAISSAGSVTSDLAGPFGAPADASWLATFLSAAMRAAVAPPSSGRAAAESAPIVFLGRRDGDLPGPVRVAAWFCRFIVQTAKFELVFRPRF